MATAEEILQGQKGQYKHKIKGNRLKAIGNDVLACNMYFGEQKTAGGIIVTNDDGKTRGIYPRWCQVYDKGPDNTDEYQVGDWVLVAHGRWSRAIELQQDNGAVTEIRKIDPEEILIVSDKKPSEFSLGAEYGDNVAPTTARPEDFGAT